MDEKEVSSKAAEVITDKPLTVTVPLKNLKWYDPILIKLKLKKPIHNFVIKPLLVGNRYRIAARVVLIPDDILQNGIVKALMNPAYANDCVYAVAVGIQNNEFEPSESLLNLVRYQFNDTDLFNVLDVIFATIPVQDFMNSTILLKGADVLNAMGKVAKNATSPA